MVDLIQRKTINDRNAPLEQRFWSRVHKGDGCWLWTGTLITKNYGRINHHGRYHLAHRLSWELANGPIPDGLLVCHHCDNPPCVRLDHLFLGTNQENCQDASRKGRSRNQQMGKTHCQQGHPYAGENLMVQGKERRCRICFYRKEHARKLRWRARLRAMRSSEVQG